MIQTAFEEEVAVLGAVLNDADSLKEVSGILLETDFYDERNRLIWRAVAELELEKRTVDELSVTNKLKEHKVLTRAGGATYVTSLADAMPDVANSLYYAKHVKNMAVDRQLVKIGKQLQQENVPPTQKMDIAFSALSELNRHSLMSRESRAGEVSTKILSSVIEGNGFNEGVKIGFPQLDDKLRIGRDYYIILAARPGVGKSAFALQVASNVAEAGNRVLFISPEMSEEQLGKRQLSMLSGVNHEKLIKPGGITPQDIEALKQANERIRKMTLTIDDRPAQTVTSVRLAARRHEATAGLDLLIVDYLQLLCEGDDSKEQVTQVSRGLKAIAKDLNVPVLACSQLRRAYGDEVHKRPDKSMLRGSGQIEQDADQIMLMWTPHLKDLSKVEVIIDKNRHGRVGQTTLDFDNKTTRFNTIDSW